MKGEGGDGVCKLSSEGEGECSVCVYVSEGVRRVQCVQVREGRHGAHGMGQHATANSSQSTRLGQLAMGQLAMG